jgi:hypothetical protein
MRPADIPIVAISLILVGWYVYVHARRAWGDSAEEA